MLNLNFKMKNNSPSGFPSINKALFIGSVMIDLDRSNEREISKIAESLKSGGFLASENMLNMAANNFLANFEYRLEEMRYLLHLAQSDGLEFKEDDLGSYRLCERLMSEGPDQIMSWYLSQHNYRWKERRFWTEKENADMNQIAHEALKEILEERSGGKVS